eukprot:294817_1
MSDNDSNLPQGRDPTEQEKAKIANILEMLKQQNISVGSSAVVPANAADKKHAFWDTQPMLSMNDNVQELANQKMHEPLIPNKEVSELRQTPYNMPKGFVWTDIDITD